MKRLTGRPVNLATRVARLGSLGITIIRRPLGATCATRARILSASAQAGNPCDAPAPTAGTARADLGRSRARRSGRRARCASLRAGKKSTREKKNDTRARPGHAIGAPESFAHKVRSLARKVPGFARQANSPNGRCETACAQSSEPCERSSEPCAQSVLPVIPRRVPEALAPQEFIDRSVNFIKTGPLRLFSGLP